ncbi:MAG TPA: site-2 protease family protein [Vicinamibacterales bacterium]|nr:site-2 protease family protein [Vicinamibacterales bacterium]
MPLAVDQVIFYFLVLIVSLSVHEAAHAWSADLLGDPTASRLGRVTLNPMAHIDPIGTVLFPLIAITTGAPVIGWAKPVPVGVRYLGPQWRQKFMLIAAAGPISNLVLALLVSALLHLGAARTGTALDLTSSSLLYKALTLNVTLAVFNMIPVPPLDGGNVLAGLVSGKAANVLDRVRPYGFIVLYALLLTGVVSTVLGLFAAPIVSWLD